MKQAAGKNFFHVNIQDELNKIFSDFEKETIQPEQEHLIKMKSVG